jgi:hypothetical protein
MNNLSIRITSGDTAIEHQWPIPSINSGDVQIDDDIDITNEHSTPETQLDASLVVLKNADVLEKMSRKTRTPVDATASASAGTPQSKLLQSNPNNSKHVSDFEQLLESVSTSSNPYYVESGKANHTYRGHNAAIRIVDNPFVKLYKQRIAFIAQKKEKLSQNLMAKRIKHEEHVQELMNRRHELEQHRKYQQETSIRQQEKDMRQKELNRIKQREILQAQHIAMKNYKFSTQKQLRNATTEAKLQRVQEEEWNKRVRRFEKQLRLDMKMEKFQRKQELQALSVACSKSTNISTKLVLTAALLAQATDQETVAARLDASRLDDLNELARIEDSLKQTERNGVYVLPKKVVLTRTNTRQRLSMPTHAPVPISKFKANEQLIKHNTTAINGTSSANADSMLASPAALIEHPIAPELKAMPESITNTSVTPNNLITHVQSSPQPPSVLLSPSDSGDIQPAKLYKFECEEDVKRKDRWGDNFDQVTNVTKTESLTKTKTHRPPRPFTASQNIRTGSRHQLHRQLLPSQSGMAIVSIPIPNSTAAVPSLAPTMTALHVHTLPLPSTVRQIACRPTSSPVYTAASRRLMHSTSLLENNASSLPTFPNMGGYPQVADNVPTNDSAVSTNDAPLMAWMQSELELLKSMRLDDWLDIAASKKMP